MPYPRLSALLAATTLAACAPGVDEYEDPFVATGEIIALSGGDAGAEAACFTCHGMNGQGDGARTPRIAGLDEGYMLKQLNNYGSDLRPHDPMSSIARRLSDADRARVARYYARMAPRAAAPVVSPDPARIAAGRALYHQGLPDQGVAACAACHGPDGQGLGGGNPALTGQSPAYLAAQLRLWRSAKRHNDPRDVMGAVSRPLSDAQIAAVSAYAASLPHPTPE
ncbi:MAG: c-type cytochrome [Brevundimonas sp.]